MKNVQFLLVLVFSLFCFACTKEGALDTEPRLPVTTDERVEVFLPQPYQTISSPVQVSGKARGYWFFEGSFPVMVVDWDGRIIGESFATAQSDWMTEDFVDFQGEISFSLPPETPYKRGMVIFQRHNASGLPEHDAAVEIPVMLE